MSYATADRMDRLDGEERLRRLRRLGVVARLMDTAIRIPGTGIRFGMDSIVGLVPGIGDGAGLMIGLYIVYEAQRLGVPAHKLARMIANLGLDAVVGAVPVAGDVFDVFFKANRRNFELVLDHFDEYRAEFARDITPRR